MWGVARVRGFGAGRGRFIHHRRRRVLAAQLGCEWQMQHLTVIVYYLMSSCEVQACRASILGARNAPANCGTAQSTRQRAAT